MIGAELHQYILDNHWNQTRTEGYDHNAAARVENRNKRVKKQRRRFLLHATGGRMFYQQYWGNFARYSNTVMLNTPVAGDKSPLQRTGIGARDLRKHGHVPGTKCTYWIAPERRQAGDDVPGRLRIWGGFSDEVPGGHIMVLG